MSQIKVIQEIIEEEGTSFISTYFEMKNASLIFISENEGQLGTLAIAIPQTKKIVGPPLSSILLGDRNVMVARLLAEHLSQKMNKIALVSVFIKTVNEKEAGPILMRLLQKTLKKKGD